MSVETASSPVKNSHPESLLAALAAAADSDHHLWWNRGTLWVAFCIIRDGYRQERIRTSLGTSDFVVARQRRDTILKQWVQNPDARLSLRLRYPNPNRREA